MRFITPALVTVVVMILAAAANSTPASAGELLYGTEGNRLRRYDVDSIGSPRLVEEIFVERASGSATVPAGGIGAVHGRDINGQICFFPDGSDRFLAGEDSGQPTPPAGWGIFDARGVQVGKLTPTYPDPNPEPFGCAFNSAGLLFTTSVGEQGFGTASGQLLMWFPPYSGFPGPPGAYPASNDSSTNFCKLATDIGTAATVAIDSSSSVYVASSSDLKVYKFAPPFPTAPNAGGGCGSGTGTDFPMADVVNRSEVVTDNQGGKLLTPSGLAISDSGTLYVSSVLTGRIGEYDLAGNFLRFIVDHPSAIGSLPTPFGNPQSLALGSDGTLYYADLALQGVLPNVGPGPNGGVWRVRFDGNGDPLTPERIRDGLAFPDGVGISSGDLEQTEWLTYAGSPERRFFNAGEAVLTPSNAGSLARRWEFPVEAIITGSPVIAAVDLPGEGLTQVTYFQSWDRNLYALRVSDGSEVWRYALDLHPGAAFENAASAHVVKLDNRDRVLIGAGEILYAVDAVTGEEIWRFTAGTGCGGANPPGLCGFDAERNQIESSAYVADGMVLFGMDVNDVATGKGGFYSVDALDGSLRWFFDLQSGQTCTPDPGDAITHFDGYHSETELGLPTGFFASRSGCDFPRDRNGCGNVWSSPAVDLDRELIFTASSNCDTPIDGGTGLPEPMPPFDEAIFALDFDGNAVWRWRPREYDNDDLAFGGVPNLFTILVGIGGTLQLVDVVGVGNKDGTYYVLDRTGTNQKTGASWDDDPATHLPAGLPYWTTNVVPGGDIGGIISTAAVDEDSRRVYFSTALGDTGGNPAQTPVVHALDMDTGAIVWQSNGANPVSQSFAPTSAIPGVAFIGSTPTALSRTFRTDDDSGTLLGSVDLDHAAGVASAPAIIDGTVLVGEGVGTRSQTGSSPGDLAANTPSDLNALCVAGTTGCAACDDGVDNDGDGDSDFPDDAGCVSEADPSEVLGDLDYDGDVDDGDEIRMLTAIGTVRGETGFVDSADFDRDGTPSAADYQTWQDARTAFEQFEIDIRINPPWFWIGLERWWPVGVVLFGSETFDVDDVDQGSLAFGPGGAPGVESYYGVSWLVFDFDHDGYDDAKAFFQVAPMGLSKGIQDVCLTGTSAGRTLVGCSTTMVNDWHCGLGFELVFVLPPLFGLRRRLRRA